MSETDASSCSRDEWQRRANALRPQIGNFIGGELVGARSGEQFESLNPANGRVIAQIPRSGEVDVDVAVRAARRAFRSGFWSRMEPRERMEVLYRFAALVEERAAELALLDTLEMGKPIADMLAVDVPRAVLTLRYFAETIDKIEGAVTNTAADALHYVLRQPLGVVGCIVPWNDPLLMAVWKIAPALAAGNTVVLKPAEQSPLSATLLAALFVEAGGPSGVLNVVNGFGDEAGRALALHEGVDKISFTGSVEVGKLMLVYAGRSNMKRVTTECGGKSPQIILADAPDLDVAVDYAVSGIYANQGEVCNAGSRLLVEEDIQEEFIELFSERATDAFVPGDPLDPETTMGPLVSRAHQRRVVEYIEIGKREGARVAFQQDTPQGLDAGAYVAPVLFRDVDNRMRIAREEIFGPVAVVIPVRDASHAIAVANDSIYGLAASIWTRDVTLAHRFARDIEAGVVWVNCFDHGDSTAPWGGYKQSGTGRDKCMESILQHTQTKSVWVHLGD